ncbi:hypothetical protein Smp_069820 [Schistosoma mansoni]|uniref:Uncharacterized protein n=1 Tax=Schistosoma mansoni TaxID=6183 RepID=G4VK59_SCHMA|nr:hypothetical protein Smp_069820 [Schistosoma mansoni]|eukprot:XP_018652669.1 hypothetical protein Smp_069820 [Schistosoma mansoni]
MGAEQSVSQQKSHNFTRYSQLNSFQSTKGSGRSSSLPSSPQYDWHRSSLPGLASTSYLNNTNNSRNYGSLQTPSKQKQQQRGSVSSLPKDTLASSSTELGLDICQRSSSTKSLTYSSFDKLSSTTNRRPAEAGILIVNRGRQTSSHYDLSGSRDGCSNDTNNHTELGRVMLKKLQRIPTFEPLLSTMKVQYHSSMATTIANQPYASTSQSIPSLSSSTSTSFKKRQFIPNIPEFDCEALVKMSSIYEQYLHKYTTELSQKQSDLIIIQNKIDRDISQLVDTLQAREKGISNNQHSISSIFQSPFNSPKKVNTTISSINDSSKLSGSQQIESIVLLTSQISCLLTQCDELSKQLMNSINNLNELLPE